MARFSEIACQTALDLSFDIWLQNESVIIILGSKRYVFKLLRRRVHWNARAVTPLIALHSRENACDFEGGRLGIDEARNRSRSTDQLVGRWLARVNRNDDVAGEPTPPPFVNRPGPRARHTPTRSPLSCTCVYYWIRTETCTRTYTRSSLCSSRSLASAPARARARASPKYATVSVSLGIAPIACFSGARANKYPCGRLQGGLMELIKMCSINRTAACPPPPPSPPPSPPLTSEATHCVPPYPSRIASAILSRLAVEPDERNRIFAFR